MYKNKSWNEIFKKELSQIEDTDIIQILDNVFKEIHESHKWLPASSSGKYHPSCDLGDGGLIRHSKVVFQFVTELIVATPELESIKDLLKAAALIHDFCKYPDGDESHSNFSHSVDMSELIKKTNFRNLKASEIARLVSTHMGKWNKAKFAPGVELPVPVNFDEKIVHYADLMASRAYIEFKFDDNGDLITTR